MRTQVLAAVLAVGALLGGCYRMAEPNPPGPLTQASNQVPLDVVGPRVDPRTRTGAAARAGSVPDIAQGQKPVAVEPERNHRPEPRD
jgi:hypothetical protein